MRMPRYGNILFALAVGLGLAGLGCGKSSPAAPGATATTTTPGTGTTGTTGTTDTAASTAPLLQYDFYTPVSEEGLKADTNYGYLIAKTPTTFKEGLFTAQGLEIVGKFTLDGYNYYRLHKEAGIMNALADLKTTRGVIFAEPELMEKTTAGIVYDHPDPRALSEEYSIFLTHAKDAWTTFGFGPNKPTVVDVDTGINYAHEDLTGNVTHAFSWYNPTTTTTALAAYSDPVDLIGTTQTNTDGNGHGTHTAGTIVATGNNGKGVAGVCWQANLVSYKGLSDAGSGGTWAIYGSLYHLIQWKKANYNHTIPVNMSLGGTSANQFAIDMIEAGLRNNVVVIASMGNTGQNMAQYPAAYSGVIAVGATNGADKKVHFSTSGRHISVCAPGYNILSCDAFDDGSYASESGTSQAAPFVTGLVTYMLTFAPDLTPAQIKTYLESNTDLIEGATGFTETTGWGRVNVLKTIGAVVADVNASKAPASNYINAELKVKTVNTLNGGTLTLTGVPVHLYSCDAAGKIANYVGSSISMAGSLAGTLGSGNPVPEDGVCFFNLLKPGTYVAKGLFSGALGTSPVFTVAAGATSIPDLTVTFALPIYNIQTLPDAGSTGVEDDIITVWNPVGTKIATVDSGNLDSAQLLLTTSGTYTFKIGPYTTSTIGEHALYVSNGSYGADTAPGTYAAPATGALAGSQSQVQATPQAINLNQLYNCLLTTAGNYYSFIVP